MAEKPSGIAKAAFVVSMCTALFSGYQWWTEGVEGRIKDTVDVVKLYAQDDYATEWDVLNILTTGRIPHDDPNTRQNLNRYMRRMEYISFLANKERLDTAFIPLVLKCDVVRLAKALENEGSLHRLPEVSAFANRAKPECPQSISN